MLTRRGEGRVKNVIKVPLDMDNSHRPGGGGMNMGGVNPYTNAMASEEVTEVILAPTAWDSGEVTIAVEDILHVSTVCSIRERRANSLIC